MTSRRAPTWLALCLWLLTRKEECSGFVTHPCVQRCPDDRYHAHPFSFSPLARRTGGTAAALAAAARATPEIDRSSSRTVVAAGNPSRARTALHATGFGPPPPERPHPDPSAYYPNEDDADRGDGSPPTGQGGGVDSSSFPKLRMPRKVEEPRGIGTLFEARDEVIRELSSEEYLDLLRDWAPIASFASAEALDDKIKEEALCTLTVLRGMAEWQPRRNADYTKLGSKWSFGAPIGAIKGGQVDALACLQVSEDEGVVVEWICGNPVTLGIPGNAVDWLAKGIHALCGKRLDLPVTISPKARGEGGDRFEAGGGGGGVGGGYGGGGGGRGGWGGGKGKKKGSSGKRKGGSKKR